MDAHDLERRVRRFVDEVWNKGNYDATKDLYAETYANGFGTGPDARAEPIRRYRHAFPGLRLEPEEVVATDDVVVLRATFRGTDTGGHAGRPATGRSVDEWVVTIMHFEGDKVVREWVGADKLGLFIQLKSSRTRGPGRRNDRPPTRRDGSNPLRIGPRD